jgi:hypothetical protein
VAPRLRYERPMMISTIAQTIRKYERTIESVASFEMYHITPAVIAAAAQRGIDLHGPITLSTIAELLSAMESES